MGSQELIRNYQLLLGRSMVKVETCIYLNGRNWAAQEVYPEKAGLSGALSLTKPPDWSALPAER